MMMVVVVVVVVVGKGGGGSGLYDDHSDGGRWERRTWRWQLMVGWFLVNCIFPMW